MTSFTARDVAEIVGLNESRIRYWAQTGFVGPTTRRGDRALYSFQDLIGVKAAKELLDRGLSIQRVRKTVEALRLQLPTLERPLARLRVLSDGDRLVVALEDGTFEPLSGQLVMDFDVGALSGRVAQVMELARPAPEPPPSAYARFLTALELEEAERTSEAMAAYQEVLVADANFAAAHTNLGTLRHRGGELDEARHHFERALALDPAQPEARYNLGNLLDEKGDTDGAIAAWTRVAEECPEFADAHFNLGLAFARDGAKGRATAHLEHYLALEGDEEGRWAERARTLLRDLH